MNKTTKILIAIVALAVSYGTGRYLSPSKVETKETVKTETEYITRIIKQKDGTIIKEKIKKDTKDTTKESKTESIKPQYKVSVFPQYNLETSKTKYGGSVEKRVLGNVFIGVYGDTDKNIGVAVTLEL
jgi:hypothetical protein